MNMTSIPRHDSFLVDIVIDDFDGGFTSTNRFAAADRALGETRETGLPSIVDSWDNESDDVVVMSVPVYREGEITTIVCFIVSGEERLSGVMEVWQPIGAYDELSMTKGYFGAMERFQNVSSFIRFEKGAGLPGQVWRNASFIIHDDLPSHSGFLRAAGASADALQVAVGMPVMGDDFLASVLLISSSVAPIGRGFEVWRCAGEEFVLESVAYQTLDESFRLLPEARLSSQGSLPGLIVESATAVICDDPSILSCGRECDRFEGRAVGIPFFEGGRVTNILVMLL